MKDILETIPHTRMLLFMMLICVNFTFSQNDLTKAVKLIDSLKNSSPKYHGVPLNKYIIIDLNSDNVYEVIERSNRIEEDKPGFLPSNISHAFDYDKIYSLNKGKFKLNNNKHKRYLYSRKSNYEFWLEIFKNPQTLEKNHNSFKLIEANVDYFIHEIEKLLNITRIQINSE